MKQRATLWFVAGALAGAAGLALLTQRAIVDERARVAAGAEARYEEDLRTALARMDLYFGPLLARAVARTERVGIASGPTAFRVSLPVGVAVPESVTPPLDPFLEDVAILACELGMNQVSLDREPQTALDANSQVADEVGAWVQRGQARSETDYANRFNAQSLQTSNMLLSNDAQKLAVLESPIRTGPLVGGWEQSGDGGVVLVFTRRIGEGDLEGAQSFRFEWGELQRLLLDTAVDLLPDATLARLSAEESQRTDAFVGDRLGTVPARLVASMPPVPAGLGRGLRSTLFAAWILGLGALVAVASALISSQRDAARQRRFRSAVTHELRTPLTTFRMYAEMLRAEMVPAERRGEYLLTLEREAERLEGLVENVLAHARLEEGRAPRGLETTTVAALVERDREALVRRAALVGARLTFELGVAGATSVRTAPEAIGQILANLVDNAAKYGVPEGGHRPDAPIELGARCDERTVVLWVADHGPGVPHACVRGIFRAFDRGGRDESDRAPGVGLGLALARDLARSLGGELTLVPSETGARFELRLPLGG